MEYDIALAKEIREAYVWIRANNSSIPDNVLDFMKDSALDQLYQRRMEGYEIKIDELGYVRYIDHLGTDTRIVEAARVSYNAPSKGAEQDKKLLKYLYRNHHTSPFEQCNITFNIKIPIFVMRQFVRHRTFRLTEMSGRYTEFNTDVYLPGEWRLQATDNKQGSIKGLDLDNVELDAIAKTAYDQAFHSYHLLLGKGVAKELARTILPVGCYTEIYVNCDLHNLLHFLKLRLHPHAQKEVRDVAGAMMKITKELYPWSVEAFEEYTLGDDGATNLNI